ncbi:MAG TPA: UpxY family transcription antiterminator [Candidatus Angelobacter sp.]
MNVTSCNAWFAVQVRPRFELTTARVLQSKGYGSYVPLYKEKRQWSDRQKEVESPLFPGYVFCRFRAEAHLPIVTTIGVIRILGTKKQFIVIEDAEMQAIQKAADSAESAPEPHPYIAVGSKVRVVTGPLAGVEGILSEHKNRRLILSIGAIQRSLSVTIEEGSIAFLSQDVRPKPMMVADKPAESLRTAG